MSDPQVPPPIPQAPQSPLAAPAPAPVPPYAAPVPPTTASAYSPPPGAYLQPAQGYQKVGGDYTPPAAGKKSGTPGVVGLVLSLLVLIVPGIIAGITGFAIGEGLDVYLMENGEGLDFLAPVRSEVFLAEVTFWIATPIGITAFVLGIIGARRVRRARGAGIAAIVLSAVAALSYAAVGTLAFVGGVTAAVVA